jgi:hypothetical protein
MIQPGPRGVSQVNGEELDDEKDIVHPAHPTSEVVVLQPDTRVHFTIILDNVARHSKALWEASVAHGASECFWPRHFMSKAASFSRC